MNIELAYLAIPFAALAVLYIAWRKRDVWIFVTPPTDEEADHD